MNTGAAHASYASNQIAPQHGPGGVRMNVVDGVTHVLEISYWLRMVLLLALTLGIVWKCVGKRLRACALGRVQVLFYWWQRCFVGLFGIECCHVLGVNRCKCMV